MTPLQKPNAELYVNNEDTLVMCMLHETPAGVPVYLDYGTKYFKDRPEQFITPADAWDPPSKTNGNRWVKPNYISK